MLATLLDKSAGGYASDLIAERRHFEMKEFFEAVWAAISAWFANFGTGYDWSEIALIKIWGELLQGIVAKLNELWA